jgi:hypothetical protein
MGRMSRNTWNLNVVGPDATNVSGLSDAEALSALHAIMRGEQPVVVAPREREDQTQLVAA